MALLIIPSEFWSVNALPYPHKIGGGYLIVNQSNSGVSAARNTGFEHAKGEYIWFIDSDDYIAPNSLKLIEHEIDKTSANILAIKRNAVSERQDYSAEAALALQKENKPQTGANTAINYIVKRELLTENEIKFKAGMAYGEDFLWCFWVNFFNKSNIPTIPQTLYFYRLRAGSAMHTKTAESRTKHLDAMMEMLDTYVEALHKFESSHDCEKITNIKHRISWSVDNILMDAVRMPRKQALEIRRSLKEKHLITRQINWSRLTLKNGYKNLIISAIGLPIKNKLYFSLLNLLSGK